MRGDYGGNDQCACHSEENKKIKRKMEENMKKLLSGILAFSIAASAWGLFAAAEEAPYVKASKTNYIVGTTGALTPIGAETVTYTSSDESIAAVAADGTITAVAPGSAVITPSVGEAITVTVYDKRPDDVESNIVDDMNAGKLTYSYNNRWDKMVDLRKGTKLWGYCSDGGTTVYEDAVFQAGTGNALCGFVYKLDGELDSLTAYTRTFDELDVIKPKTQIAYLTDDTVSFATNTAAGITTWDDAENLTQYAVEKGVVADWAPPAALNPMWQIVPEADIKWDWNCDGMNTAPYLCAVKTSAIPREAKYVLVVIKNPTADADGARYRYKGIKLDYKVNLVAGEFVDNKAVLTFNSDIGGADGIAVKKNNVAMESPTIEYDPDTYTAIIDGSFANADDVEITTPYGNYTGKVPGEPLDIDYDKLYFSTAKTKFIEGMTGKIDLIVVNGEEQRKDLLPTTYTSDNTDVATVDNKGNITAVSAGTANITPSVNGVAETFAPITVKVYAKSAGKVESNVQQDVADGKLILDYERTDNTSAKRNGTKLWAYSGYNQLISHAGTNTVYNSQNEDSEFASFIYKLEGELDSITAHTWGYGEIKDYAPVRTDIGYLTDDAVTFANQAGEGSYTWDSPDLNWFAAAGGAVKTITAPISLNTEVWTKAEDVVWKFDGDRGMDVSTSSIPADAKYIIVLLRSGQLADGTQKLDNEYFRYKGITLNYKIQLAEGALAENKVELMFNGDIGNTDGIVVKKNGTVVESPQIAYDKNSFTATVDGGFLAADEISIETPYGNYGTTMPDTREQISGVSVFNDNTEIDELTIEMTSVKAVIKAENVLADRSLTAYAALYDDQGRMVCVKTAVAAVTNTAAQAELALTDITVDSGYSLKIYLWDDEISPVANYKNIKTVLGTEDF